MTSRGTRYWSSGTIPLFAPDLLGDIIAKSADIALVISDMGQILSVLTNPDHAMFGRLEEWEGRDVREVLTVESVAKLDDRLASLRQNEAGEGGRMQGLARPIELNHVASADLRFPVRYSFHVIGPDGALLMLGRDLRPVAEMQQQLVKAQLALERDYESQRQVGTRLRVLLDATRDAMVFVSLGSGRIIDLNAAAAKLLGRRPAELTGASFAQEVEGQEHGDLLDVLAASAAAEQPAGVDLVTRRTLQGIRISGTLFRAAGERMLLCRLDPAVSAEGAGGHLSDRLLGLYAAGSDGIVFADRDGMILSVNEAFLGLIDQPSAAAVRGGRLDAYLARGQVDLNVLMDQVQQSGRLRLYATRLFGAHDADVPVEVSATWLKNQAPPCLALVFRDAGRAEALRGGGFGPSAEGGEGTRSAMELVGSATLKEIVADATDVIEKMCIETAVELTGNNRVAAAEMLGLSRQSLYVKLRKYGLLARGPD